MKYLLEEYSEMNERETPEWTGVEGELNAGTEVVDSETGEILILAQRANVWKVEKPSWVHVDYPWITFWNKGAWIVGYDTNMPLFKASHSGEPVWFKDEYNDNHVFGVLG